MYVLSATARFEELLYYDEARRPNLRYYVKYFCGYSLFYYTCATVLLLLIDYSFFYSYYYHY